MPRAETLERFIAKVESNAHVEAIAEFYAPNASMQENESPPRTGRTRLEELAYQRWEGDRVVEEKFFYDPRQLQPRFAD